MDSLTGKNRTSFSLGAERFDSNWLSLAEIWNRWGGEPFTAGATRPRGPRLWFRRGTVMAPRALVVAFSGDQERSNGSLFTGVSLRP